MSGETGGNTYTQQRIVVVHAEMYVAPAWLGAAHVRQGSRNRKAPVAHMKTDVEKKDDGCVFGRQPQRKTKLISNFFGHRDVREQNAVFQIAKQPGHIDIDVQNNTILKVRSAQNREETTPTTGSDTPTSLFSDAADRGDYRRRSG